MGRNTIENQNEILDEVKDFCMIAHCLWALWYEIEAKLRNSEESEYAANAAARMDCYRRIKLYSKM